MNILAHKIFPQLCQWSVNDQVWVKLTDHGIRVWADHWRSVREFDPSGKWDRGIPVSCWHVDDEGRTRFQLWYLMQIFGHEMYNGNVNQCFEENAIWGPEEFDL